MIRMIEKEEFTIVSLLKACAKNRDLIMGAQLHALLMKRGGGLLSHSHYLSSALINMYAKCGALSKARQVLEEIPRRHITAWNALISGYAKLGHGHEALRLHKCMLQDGVEPNNYTYVALFKACGSMEDVREGMRFHMEASKKGYTSDVYVGSSLVSMYGKCEATMEAENVFENIQNPNVVSWNAMLCIYVEHGHVENALLLYRQMKESSYVNEDQHTLMFVIHACTALMEREKTLADEHGYRVKVISELGHALHADARKKTFLL